MAKRSAPMSPITSASVIPSMLHLSAKTLEGAKFPTKLFCFSVRQARRDALARERTK